MPINYQQHQRILHRMKPIAARLAHWQLRIVEARDHAGTEASAATDLDDANTAINTAIAKLNSAVATQATYEP